MMLETLADNYLWFLVAILMVNLYQKRFTPRSDKKRIATLVIACMAMLWQIFIVIILSRGWPHWLAAPAFVLTLACAIPFRRRLLVFKTHCAKCDANLSFTAVLNYDDNLCDTCWSEEHPEERQPVLEDEEPATPEPSQVREVAEIDWDAWEPTETAVLCYLFSKDRVLLIDKKTGLGKGLVNAPGGHVEEDETAAEAAMREITEETGVTVSSVEHRGVLEFQFTDGLAMRGHVFFAREYTGEPRETDEAVPFWCPVSELPYDRMWEDDRLWLPLALEGKRFAGRFIFDGERMLSSHLIEEEATPA